MPAGARGDVAPAVVAFRAFAQQLMAEAGTEPTPRSLDLRKLRLTEGYREALRQAPREHAALFAVWDAAYRVLERLHWELEPPVLDPPPPTYEEARRQYKALKRERERQAEGRTVQWHPLELGHAPAPMPPDDGSG
jgi:hypothetical protein